MCTQHAGEGKANCELILFIQLLNSYIAYEHKIQRFDFIKYWHGTHWPAYYVYFQN